MFHPSSNKKIGKNNPKAQEIEADNQKRREWNRAVEALEFLIASVLFKKPREVPKQIERTETEHPEQVAENSTAAVKTTKEEKPDQRYERLPSKDCAEDRL